MPEIAAEPPRQVQAAIDILRDLFQDALLGVYLHGSAVSGGLRPQSDLDLLVVLDHPMTQVQRGNLLSALLRISATHPALPGGPRCMEVMAFLESDLAAPEFPARAEFVYGEWLRDVFEAGQIPVPVSDPEITLLLAQARQVARPLVGPAAAGFLPEIPPGQVRHAMRAVLPVLLDGLRGDERNVLLTLARMWRTATTGEFVAKDAAATWAAPRLPAQEADMLIRAREAYLGKANDNRENRQAAVRQTAACLCRHVLELL